MSPITYSLTDIDNVIDQYLLPIIQDGTIILLYGQLGTGKTTLVKVLAKQLGITAPISSPTFTYVNTYISTATSLAVHHFDLYRLHSAEEFIAQGFEEFLTQKNSLVIIEWPEIIEEVLLSQKKSSHHRHNLISINLTHDFQLPEIRHMVIRLG